MKIPVGFPTIGKNKKPTVLIIVENLPVPLDRRVWQESRALRDAGHEVVVICPKMRGYHKSSENLENIQIYRHWISDEAGGFMGFFAEYASALVGELILALKVWLLHRPKIIHLCNPPDLLFLVAFPFKLLGAKVIYDVHDAWPEMYEAKFNRKGLFYWFVRLAEFLTYRTADVVIATNESVRDIALSRGRVKPSQVYVVRTSPNIDRQVVDPDPTHKKDRKFLVGYVGVMGNADGVEYLVRAAAEIVHNRSRKDIQFLLMGTGPEFEALKSLRDSLNLKDFVSMPGRVSNDFLFSALETMDLGVSSDPINPYNHHCTMNKVLEYMTFGKPQVLFDLKEGRASAADAAHYVSENSPQALADGITHMIDSPRDREKMGAIGLQRMAGNLSWAHSVDNLKKAYAAALGKKY